MVTSPAPAPAMSAKAAGKAEQHRRQQAQPERSAERQRHRGQSRKPGGNTRPALRLRHREPAAGIERQGKDQGRRREAMRGGGRPGERRREPDETQASRSMP